MGISLLRVILTNVDLKARIQIWEGLDNFRQVLLDLLTHDINKINQASLDRIFSGYGFKLKESRKSELPRAQQPPSTCAGQKTDEGVWRHDDVRLERWVRFGEKIFESREDFCLR